MVFPAPGSSASAGVVGQHEAQRHLWKHVLVHGGDLVRQGLYSRGTHRQVGVEEMRKVDAVRLADELELVSVGVEGPLVVHSERERLLHVAVEHDTAEDVALGLVRECQGEVPEPLNLYCDDGIVSNNSNDT